MKTVFCCENITKSYQNVPTVEDISLSLEKGGLVSLLGVSGVGKTTLFNILAGVDVPDSGRVLLYGEDVTGQAGKVGYMLQKDLLLPYKHLVDNVSLPLILRGIPKKEARAQASALFERFGLSGCEKKYPAQLSGGMRQRAALLRTHLTGNKIILLDEPFSALDAITKTSMHKWYLDVAADISASTLFITHDVDEAIILSDKIYILSGFPGRVTAELSPPPHPRPADFATSDDFMRLKRKILTEIGA